MHGGNGDENLYLIDGTPLYDTNHALGLFSSFNADVVKNVDFYKSGFPARYGGRLSSVYSTLETGLSVILLSASSSGRVILLLSSISTLFLHIAHCDKGNEKFGGSQKNNVFYGLLTSLYSGFRTYFIPFTKHLLRLCCSVLKYSHCACTLPFSSSSGLLSAYSKPSC